MYFLMVIDGTGVPFTAFYTSFIQTNAADGTSKKKGSDLMRPLARHPWLRF
jgi:hypothetical protein